MSNLRRHIMMQQGGGQIGLLSVNGAYVSGIYNPTNATEIEITFRVPTGINVWIYGADVGFNGARSSFGQGISWSRFGSGYYGLPSLNDGEKHTIKRSLTEVWLDDVLVSTFPSASFVPSTYDIALYRASWGSSLGAQPIIIYNTKIRENGLLVRDLQPMLNSQNKWAFFDDVNSVFYNNIYGGSSYFEPVYI